MQSHVLLTVFVSQDAPVKASNILSGSDKNIHAIKQLVQMGAIDKQSDDTLDITQTGNEILVNNGLIDANQELTQDAEKVLSTEIEEQFKMFNSFLN